MWFEWSNIQETVRDFACAESGSVAAETVITLPILMWAYVATFVWFDAFRSETQYMKAAYSMADSVSREVAPITSNYVNSMERLLNFMSDSEEPVRLRLTVVCWSDAKNQYHIAWSQVRGPSGSIKPHNDVSINKYSKHLPSLPEGDQVIFLETWTEWVPAFNMGLSERTIYNPIVTRARFAPQVIWDPNHDLRCTS